TSVVPGSGTDVSQCGRRRPRPVVHHAHDLQVAPAHSLACRPASRQGLNATATMARGGLPTNAQALAAENFALRLHLATVQQQLAMALDEVGKLRLITNSPLTRQATLLEQLRSAQAAGRQVSASVLGAALSAALERAAGSMENRTISRARAHIRALLQIEDGEPGLVIGDPRIAESASLSTLTLDLLPVSPTLAQLAMQSALARVQNRLLR